MRKTIFKISFFCLIFFPTITDVLVEKRKKIVIVGAGLAGLVAAKRLYDANLSIDLEVREARSRPGGRVLTIDCAGSRQELGGTNLLDGGCPVHIMTLVKDLGLTIEKNITLDRNVKTFFNGKVDDEASLIKSQRPPNKFFKQEIKDFSDKAENLQEVLNHFFPGKDLAFREYLEMRLKGWEGLDSIDLAADFATSSMWDIYKGVYQRCKRSESADIQLNSWTIAGGNSKMIEALINSMSVPIHYNMPLIEIKQLNDGSIQLIFADNQIVLADVVILAIPCSIVKDIKTSENLFPEDQQDAIQNLAYGTNAKVLMPFNCPTKYDAGSFVSKNFITWFDEKSSVMTWYFGGKDGVFNHYSQDELDLIYDQNWNVIKSVLPNFSAMVDHIDVFNENQLSYSGAVGLSWINEEYSKGSFSTKSPNNSKIFQKIGLSCGEPVCLAFRPINNQIFFAGEHTALFGASGCMEGAVQSGDCVAKMIQYVLKNQVHHNDQP